MEITGVHDVTPNRTRRASSPGSTRYRSRARTSGRSPTHASRKDARRPLHRAPSSPSR
jgi:hypothetical protein